MNLTYFLFFICIIVCTLIITYWAAKQSKTAGHFYTTAGSLTGIQNGMAIAGDYISAASFLGIVGAIALNGYDGFLRSEEHTSELQSRGHLVCRLLLEKNKQ